ncbi:uncharacterized protein LOC115215647 [Argonauta hians]
MAQSENEDKYKVEVYIYDLSKGMATALSVPLLGKQINGIWHTGIVVFGMEYYFGSDGISYCKPAQTVIGQPDTIENLGTTSISYDVFKDFLYGLSTDQFKPQTYNLFDHNCNTFSNEVAQFLTGNKIPSYIIDLPAEVANTPLGSMMKSMTNKMTIQPSGGRTLFSPYDSTDSSSDNSPVTYPSDPLPNREIFASEINETEKKLLDDIYTRLTSGSSSHNLNTKHLKMLVMLVIKKNNIDSIIKCAAVSLLQELMIKKNAIDILQQNDDHIIAYLLQEFKSFPPDVMVTVLKLVTNVCSSDAGFNFLTSAHENRLESVKEYGSNSEGGMFSYLALTGEAVVTGLLLEHSDINDVAAAAVYNFHRTQMNEDLLIAVSSALTQCLQRVEISEKTALLGLQSLRWFIELNEGVCALVKMMELDYQRLSQKSVQVKETCKKITNILQQLKD